MVSVAHGLRGSKLMQRVTSFYKRGLRCDALGFRGANGRGSWFFITAKPDITRSPMFCI